MQQLLAGVAVVLVLTGVARAQDVAEAKKHYSAGLKHFDLGEFREALGEFKEAYRVREDPVFLYNIAQCHRLLKENKDAVLFYKSYLRRAPNASNRVEVEQKIATLQEAIATQEKAATMPPTDAKREEPPAAVVTAPAPEPVPVTEKTPVYKKWWLWTAVGAAVLVGVGVGLGVGLTRSSGDDAANFPGVSF